MAIEIYIILLTIYAQTNPYRFGKVRSTVRFIATSILGFSFTCLVVLRYGIFVGFPRMEWNGTPHHTCHKSQQMHFKAQTSMACGAMPRNQMAALFR